MADSVRDRTATGPWHSTRAGQATKQPEDQGFSVSRSVSRSRLGIEMGQAVPNPTCRTVNLEATGPGPGFRVGVGCLIVVVAHDKTDLPFSCV